MVENGMNGEGVTREIDESMMDRCENDEECDAENGEVELMIGIKNEEAVIMKEKDGDEMKKDEDDDRKLKNMMTKEKTVGK